MMQLGINCYINEDIHIDKHNVNGGIKIFGLFYSFMYLLILKE